MKSQMQPINQDAFVGNKISRPPETISQLRRGWVAVIGLATLILLSGPMTNAFAETDLPHPLYTWSLNPTNNDWSTATNWTPQGIPDTQSERAAFGSSSITDLVANVLVNSVEFNPGASPYTITGNLTFNEGGVTNNSGVVQTFNGTFRFQKNGATAGSLVTFNTTYTFFGKGTSGGSATYINNGLIRFFGGYRQVWYTTAGAGTFINNGVISFHKADAGSATFTNNGGAAFGVEGGLIEFNKSSDAGSSTIINNGGAVFGGGGSRLTFHKAGASSATLIANGGAGPGSGATILFAGDSSGDTARVEVFGNGNLDVSRPQAANNMVGSIEGNGLVFLGAGNLAVGGNNLNTTFAGVISDEGGVHEGSGGSIAKAGTGALTFTNANAYTGGTTIEDGSFFVNNPSGSGTGSGAVQAEAGTLGGTGTIAGAVTIGTGGASGATLPPDQAEMISGP